MSGQFIDLNCDMGESYGAWSMGEDAQVMPWITSANIACGFHAGDFSTMQQTVLLAGKHAVAIGAHVSLPDLQGFGRREMKVTAHEARALALYQIGALSAFARAAGTRVAHVKPHGALYNMAARDTTLAEAIARAVHDFDPRLILFGLAGSALTQAGANLGLRVASEAFADRRYESDGSLTPRRETDAVIHNVDAAVAQALDIATHGRVKTRDGTTLGLHADTLCVHGDRADAAQFAQRLRTALEAAGLSVRACQPAQDG
ncbi:MAG: LamB/YcsF family protein [Rudaea sp.]|nr:LamB/YcsF family protein [Rudaea sp.]